MGGPPVPYSETPPTNSPPDLGVLTLAETASFLRVPEAAVIQLVDHGDLPAQRIGGELRFLKQSLVDWLRFGPHYFRELMRLPLPWMLDRTVWDELLRILEQRILHKLPAAEQTVPERGSKQAILKHFGIFKDDADIEEQLAALRTLRDAARQ